MKRILLSGLLLASLGTSAFAAPHNDMRLLFDSLDLTTAQKEKLKTIRKEARDERNKLTDQLDDLRDKTQARIQALLTDEQKKTLQTIRKEMRQQRQSSQGCNRDRMPNRAKMTMQEDQQRN